MRAVKGGMGKRLFRLALSLVLALCLVLFAAGCGRSAAVSTYPGEGIEPSTPDSELPFLTAPRPTPSPEPTPTPLPVLTRDEAWKIPDPYGYQDETGTPYEDYQHYRYLCGDYPVPDTVEVELTSEQRQALDDFFAARPELVERIGTHDYTIPQASHGVRLVDLTGDGEAEILIPYSPLENASLRAVGGRIEVYELSSGRYLGKLYTSDFPGNWKDWACGGWYCDANGETDFYLLGYQWFRKNDPTGFSGGVWHNSFILWRVEYDGQALQSVPLWFYDSANWPAGFAKFRGIDSHISIAAPDPEEMVAFSQDPYAQYNHVFDIAEQGADPVIPQTLRQLKPVRTEYAVYEYDFPAVVKESTGNTLTDWEYYKFTPLPYLPWGLQMGERLGTVFNQYRDPPPDEITEHLADPLPEKPPEESAASWQFRWWQTREADGSLTYYRFQAIFFDLPQNDRDTAFLLWQIVPEGEGWQLCPLWLYCISINEDPISKNGVFCQEFSVLRPSLEDAVAFALDPAGQYEAMQQRGAEGVDPAIEEITARLRPVGFAE